MNPPNRSGRTRSSGRRMFVDDLEQPQTVAARFFAIEAANADRNSGVDLRDEMFPLMAADYTD